MNIGNMVDNAVAKYGDRPFLQFDEETVTYNEFGRRVNMMANELKKMGIGKGNFVHVLVQNSPETLVAYYAIIKIGAVAGPINGWWKAREVEYLLNDSQGKVLIIEDQYLDILEEIRGNCPHLETVIVVGECPEGDYIPWDSLMDGADDTPVECKADPEDTAYIFYTSGTTGNPKGVLLSHKNLFADVNGATEHLKLEEGMVVLIFLPLFHVNAMLSIAFSLVNGFTVVLRRAFSAGEFWEVVDRYKVNFWSAVPAVYQILLKDPGRQQYDLSSLQFGICGAAPLSPETFNQFQETFGIPIVEGYGLTEATCVSTMNPRDGVKKVGSIGIPLPGQEVRLLDELGNEVPTGEPGEICIGGDVVMKGYYNRPEETARTIIDGWLHTGDVGVKDQDGYIFIVDRIKDMIIRGGENIYPLEIDNTLAAHPKILEAATVGVPDDTMGEEVKVYVIPSDETLTEEEVIDYCRENLAGFKVPKYVELLTDEDFPRSPIGKVLKKELREWARKGPRPKQDASGGATVADIFGTMESRVNPEGVQGITANYGYVITGEGGGEWTVCVDDGKVKVLEGIHDPSVTTTCAAKDWIAITLGKLDGMTAFTSGKLKVDGDLGLLTPATKFFKKYQPPAAAPEVTVADIFGTMESRVNPEGVAGVTANYGYVITGEGGGEWTVCVDDGKVRVVEGLESPDVTTTCAAKDWIAITLGKLDGMTAFTSGRLKVEGDMGLLTKATKFFRKYEPPSGPMEDEGEELIVKKQVLSIPQKFSTGPIMGKFLNAFKEKRILANVCPDCGRKQLPPREVCARCVVRADQWEEVGPEGEITIMDVTYYASPDPLTGESRETPYCSFHVLLDGCKDHETLWHELKPDDIPRARKGMRVKPVWAEKRKGAITDIMYFELVD
ncbi:MAG: long-chain-fatty-acid--CoA ligase [Desulfatibacillaceae bacterium]